MSKAELLKYDTRESIGFYDFTYLPEVGDLVSLGDVFYEVKLRSHGFKKDKKKQSAFAIVIKPTEQ